MSDVRFGSELDLDDFELIGGAAAWAAVPWADGCGPITPAKNHTIDSPWVEFKGKSASSPDDVKPGVSFTPPPIGMLRPASLSSEPNAYSSNPLNSQEGMIVVNSDSPNFEPGASFTPPPISNPLNSQEGMIVVNSDSPNFEPGASFTPPPIESPEGVVKSASLSSEPTEGRSGSLNFDPGAYISPPSGFLQYVEGMVADDLPPAYDDVFGLDPYTNSIVERKIPAEKLQTRASSTYIYRRIEATPTTTPDESWQEMPIIETAEDKALREFGAPNAGDAKFEGGSTYKNFLIEHVNRYLKSKMVPFKSEMIKDAFYDDNSIENNASLLCLERSKRADLDGNIYITTLMHLERFLQKTGQSLHSHNCYRLFFTLLLVTQKFTMDASYPLADFSTMSLIPSPELKNLEITVFKILDYNLFVAPGDFERAKIHILSNTQSSPPANTGSDSARCSLTRGL